MRMPWGFIGLWGRVVKSEGVAGVWVRCKLFLCGGCELPWSGALS
jgi:hypothetical protein